jgi:hypothetical protein
MYRLDVTERRARLARRHLLVQSAATIEEAADTMVGFHSSDPVTVYLSARARVPEVGQNGGSSGYRHRWRCLADSCL